MSHLADPPLRLLFDENLASRLVGELAGSYHGSVHVADVGLLGAPDRAIWQHAQEHGYVVVTKDEDFHRLSILSGPPPKVIWIRLGNCSTKDVIRLLREHRSDIQAFALHDTAAFLALG